ncbi:MAG: UDP-N-acetylmuramoyl-L-alanyl-D-glutamate--2,6-diaminopimelate ligase [Proteobacteria bacterium]|nr:UDP-N-acetylmuramoyl-L-alanyl-D-glutamate--2,6-diaminopimelate ligase [Pseudomonadota bacterium]MBU1649184.1 UDP-N-acetylmuramoyl-L-alanyl-D-glutamate--2,6-diaminopimelate ligase [Pseudomonadota bacterium]
MDSARLKKQFVEEGNCKGYLLEALLASVTYSLLGKTLPTGIVVSDVTIDSRKIQDGSLFVALAGSRTDGHAYLEQVMASGRTSAGAVSGASDTKPSFARGCAVLVVEEGRVRPEQFADCSQCVIVVADSHLAYAQIAANMYGQPAQGLTLVGVTGTNGKTTVSYLLESVLRQLGLAVGVIGTINYRYRDARGQDIEIPAPFTTPEPLLLQSLLRQMADAGVTHVIMEVSSHALVQRRLGDLQFDVVAFTNLSRDHLDYHQDMDDYFAAKALLFRDHLKKSGKAVITRIAGRDPEEEKRTQQLLDLCAAQGAQVWQCGGNGDIYPSSVQSGLDSTSITLHTSEDEIQITTSLVGDFNVANLLTVLGIGLALGVEVQALSMMLGQASGAPGRLQRIMAAEKERHFRPAVFVDYAHTPDALEKVLATLSRLPHRRLICVFGCGGDRDKGKRAIMGEIAGRCSDVVLVTDDNPRGESPQEIVGQIVSGVRLSDLEEREPSWLMASAGDEKGFLVLHDRAQAISLAIAAATVDDIVLIAGKGHERYQLGPDGTRFFDDSLEAKKGLTSWRLENLRLAAHGELIGERMGITSLGSMVTDSRKVVAGDIFVALAGERFDGHDFLKQVASAGAGCLVIRRETPLEARPAIPCLLVDDTLQALGDLAAYRRQVMKEVSGPLVVGITGSCGKTTVKEMTAAIFEQHWQGLNPVTQASFDQVLKTRGNFNNLIGLPLSLLPIHPGHRAAILEMGMNRPGEIDRLVRIADPDIACIVNVHAAHLEGLHSIEGVARAKEELFAGSGEDSTLVINLDDPHVRNCAEKYCQKKVFYAAAEEGMRHRPQVWASDLGNEGTSAQTFVLHIALETISATLHVPGVHNISNAVAAAAIAHAAGLGIGDIASGLAAFQPADKRMQIVKGKGDLYILNDTYNANPASMRAGLTTLAQQGKGRRVAILGDMLELGPTSAEAHREVGGYAAGQLIDYLALIGSFAAETATGARMAGMDSQRIRVFQEKKDAVAWIEELLAARQLQAGDWLLVKGSRGMHLEDVVEQLQDSL